MEILGLHYIIWVVLTMYFAGMLLMGWWSKQGIRNQEGFLLGNRQFGVGMMIMHAFGAGTNPGDVAGVMSKTVSHGASGIWVSWMWMFGTPFYWLIAPIIRRMRCLTLADFFQERYGKKATVFYIIVATIGMIIFLASALLATTRTVQGMMGKSVTINYAEQSVTTTPAESDTKQTDETAAEAMPPLRTVKVITERESEMWFFGILILTTVIFVIYGYWGGIVAAIRTDMVQGLMIIVLSFLAIPAAIHLKEVGSLAGMRESLGALSTAETNYLSMFDPTMFNIWAVILLCVNGAVSMLSQPHLMSVCAAGQTEWEGRVGFCYGNILKRICTMGWCILGLCWLTYLLKTGADVHPDAAFGDSVRALLNPALQGLMLACVLAAAMSSGDAIQVTVAGLFSQNIYKEYINPNADENRLLKVARVTGLFIVFAALLVAVLMRKDMVSGILDYFSIMGILGITTAMGILWRRMNTAGMITCVAVAIPVFIVTRYYYDLPRQFTTGLPMAGGVVGGIIGSLLTRPPNPEMVEKFYKKIYVPIGQEHKLDLTLDQIVPSNQRWLTAGGLFIVKPSRQSWIGFLVALGICLGCIWTLYMVISS
jgi:Na+/proline symporter